MPHILQHWIKELANWSILDVSLLQIRSKVLSVKTRHRSFLLAGLDIDDLFCRDSAESPLHVVTWGYLGDTW